MLKLIDAWREKNRTRRDPEQPAKYNEQLLADLGLSWQDVIDAKALQPGSFGESAVFP
jgi:uncharacterized protein YjiS (DUF1127 family)